MFKFLNNIRSLIFLLLFISVYASAFFSHNQFPLKKLKTVFQWKYIDYLWDSREQKEEYIRTGKYDYRNIVPIDVDVAKDGRIFITAIRNIGVPASLAIVTDHMGPSGPLLRPYPNWSWFNTNNCDGITSVYRIYMDECNHLYVLDTGYIGDNYTCPAQILKFDLATDSLIQRIKIPHHVSHNEMGVGKLVSPVVEDTGPDCKLVNIFMADVNGHGLVIYNNKRLFRLQASVFEPEEQHIHVNIANETFDLNDSLMDMAITPNTFNDKSRELILRPFASRHLYIADTRVLTRSTIGDYIKFKEGRDVLPSQATAMDISKKGILFFGLTADIAIGCWNIKKNMSSHHIDIAVKDRNRLQFASGLKVIPNTRIGTQEEVWILTNRLQKIMAGTQNFNEINFRILRGSVQDLIRGTKCENPLDNTSHYSSFISGNKFFKPN